MLPPLPPPLSHHEIAFILDLNSYNDITQNTLAAIAAGLQTILPPGDLKVDHSGTVISDSTRQETPLTKAPLSLWHQSGLLAGINRSRE